jgi:hypothetical protein
LTGPEDAMEDDVEFVQDGIDVVVSSSTTKIERKKRLSMTPNTLGTGPIPHPLTNFVLPLSITR